MSKTIFIGGRLESKEKGNVVTGANAILDDTKGKMQNVINKETDDELLRLEQSKQDNLTFDNAPTEDSTNPVTSGGVYTAEKALSDAIEAILLLIPSAATALNKLVDTNTMNSSISTATATFRGTYNVVSDLGLTYQATHAQIEAALDALGLTADNNDYAFVQVPVSDQSQDIAKTERYKNNGTNWQYEYDLNTSGFTAAQWGAINSTITLALVQKLAALPTNAELLQALGLKQDVLTFDNAPTTDSNNPVKSGGIKNAIDTAVGDEATARDNADTALASLIDDEKTRAEGVEGGLNTRLGAVEGSVTTIQDVTPSGATSSNKLVDNNSMTTYISTIIDNIDATFNITSTDGHVTLAITQVNGVITSVQLTTSDIASAAALNLKASQADLTALAGRVTTAESILNTTKADKATTIAGYGIMDAYTKTEVNDLVDTPHQNYVTVSTYASLPASGSTDTIYRVSNYNGSTSQVDASVYTEYAWNGSAYVFLSVKSQVGEVFDISEYNASAKYADLAAALGTDGANVPESVRKGGMSIKFVQSSDNKYVQYRLMAQSFTTDVTQWQGVDEEPTAGSDNLVKSGGISNTIGKLLGERSVSLIGNNSNWAILPQAKRNIILKKNIQHIITLVSNEEIVVPSGVSEGATAMLIQVVSTVSGNSLWSKRFNAPEHANNGDIFTVPPLNEDGYLYVEGRWNSTTTIDFIVDEDLFEYNIYSFGNIIADNINHKLQIPTFNIVKGGDSLQSISGVSIDYSSFIITQSSQYIICLKADNTLEYKPYYNGKSSDIVLVSISLANQTYIDNLTSLYFNTIISDKNSHFFKDEYLNYYLSYSDIFIEKGKIEIINPSLVVREEQHVNINLLTDVSYPSVGFTINDNKLTIEYVGNGYPTLFYNLATQQVTARNNYHYPPADGTLCLLKITDKGLYYGILATQLMSIKENEICDILGAIDGSFEKNVYNDVTKSGQGTTWLYYDFNVSKACPNTITFLNDATNGSTGVNYLIYCDNKQVITGQTGANIKEGTNHQFSSGYSHIQVQCRIASGESLSIRCTQDSIPEEIEKLQSPGVIARNAYQEPAIRCAGKKSIDSELKPFAFMHISDTHVRTGSTDYYKCLENARKVMDYYTNLKCCIITGDIVYDTFADPMTPYDAALGYSDKLYLNVIGNHDAGQENQAVGYLASVGTDEQVYNKFIAPYKDKWDLGNGDTGKNYYYKDFTEEKVRLIILYDFETDFELNEAGTRLKYWREACCVRQAQVDWLISTLESTPSDYGVIVAHHINYQYDSSDNNFTTPRLRNKTQDEYQYSSDKQWLEKILTAYQNKSSINITWNQTGGVVTSLTANHDFSNAEGEFICILAGHTHDDFIGHPANFQNLVLLTVGSDNLHYTGRSCARAYNHLSEDLINIVNVDRNRKTISVVRLGANYSVTGQRRDSITLSYNIGND